MQARCSRCAATTPVEDVDVVQTVVKCRACEATFEVMSTVPRGAEVVTIRATTSPPGLEIPLPSGMELHRDAPRAGSSGAFRSAPAGQGRLRIVRRWFSAESIGVVIFALSCDGLIFRFASGALSSRSDLPDLLFVCALVAVGLLLTYAGLAGLLNRTEITVDRGALSVRHGPLPAPGRREIPAGEVRQLFVVAQRVKNGGVWYELRAVVARGPVVTLAGGLTNPHQAHFLERAIEEHLGIEDQPVEGPMAT